MSDSANPLGGLGGLGGMADLALGQSKPVTPKLTGADDPALRKTAESFEATFVSTMMQEMFDGIDTDGIFGGGHGEEMFRSMMLDEYSKQIVKRGGLGIADSVMTTLLQNQEKTHEKKGS